MVSPLLNSTLYKWTRYWIAQGGIKVIYDRDDFPIYSTIGNGKYRVRMGAPLGSLEYARCLILLGEPGTGKSTELMLAKGSEGYTVKYNLSHHSTERELVDAIEALKEFHEWKSSDQKLFLYLDGFDEAMLHVRTINHALTRWLADNSEELRIRNGLFNIRIACRSSAWPSEVTQSLKEIFGDDHVQEVELAPLSEVEVKTAAQANNLDAIKFIESLKRSGLVKLALEPVTLKFLLQAFAAGDLAEAGSDKYKLYTQGCLALCSETNKSYLGVKKLTTRERMTLASRIALYCMISNKNTIVRGDERINLRETDFTADDFVGDSFRLDDSYQTPRLEDFKEVLDCALFARVGDSQFRFKHKTYSEFLAGWHLNSLVMPVKTLHQLLTSPFDKQIVFPQLREVSSWVVAANPEYSFSIGYAEPLYLISTPKEFSSAEREIIVKTMIAKAKRFELMDSHDARKFYGKLTYPALSKFIRPLIRSTRVNNVAKRIAVNIAGACRLKDLTKELLQILSDGVEPTFIRREVVSAITEIGEENSMKQLIPYALQPQPSDYDDEIKGSVLSDVYPKLISTSQMLNALTPVKSRSLYGAYRGFQDQVGDTIPEKDLVAAIDFLLNRKDSIDPSHLGDFENLVKQIVSRCWEKIADPKLLDSFSKLIAKFLIEYVQFEMPEGSTERRAVAQHLFRKYKELLKPYQFTRRGSPGSHSLLLLQDWDWLVKLFNEETDEATKIYLGEIIFYLFTLDDSTHVIEFLELAFPYQPLWLRLPHWLQPIALESDEANEQKKYRKGSVSRKDNTKSTERVDGIEAINTRATAHLAKMHEGSKDGWWRFVFDLRFNQDGLSRSDGDYVFDIRKLPGWGVLTTENREGAIDAAAQFLQAHTPNIEWIFTNQLNRQELAGYKALVLLLSIDEERLDNLSLKFWKNWVPVIVWCTFNTFNELPADQERLLRLCYAKTHDEFIRFVEEYISHQLKADKDLYDLYKLKGVADDHLATMLLKLIESPECSLKNQQNIIEALLKENLVIAQDFIQKKMSSVFQEDDRTPFSLFCASRVLLNFNALEWPQIWDYLCKNSEAGKAVFRAAADKLGYHRSNKLDLITPSQRAQLLVWLFKIFPSVPHIDNDDTHFTSPDNLVEFRSQVLRSLIESGTPEAVQAMKEAQEMYPESSDMKWWLVTAKEMLHNKAWQPVAVTQLRRVLNDPHKRFVRSGDDLTLTILESLERFQKKLKGNNPLSPFLWDQRDIVMSMGRKKKHFHKEENFLSDLIKMHLDYDLVQRRMIVNREVEIKKAVIKGQGERTDILVEAFQDITGDKVSLVIEVKGCWHPELDTSMEKQLRNRYLDKYKSSHGLYVIGWYYGPDFAKPKKIESRSSFKKKFESQAVGLSNEIVKIQAVVLDCSL